MSDTSASFDAALLEIIEVLFRFALWYVGLVIVLFFGVIAWIAGWFRK